MAKAAAVLLAPGVWRIPLLGDYVNGFMLRDDDGQVTLIDMGLASSGKKVIAALRSIGSDPSDVTRLMLTHCHPDHAGGAAYVVAGDRAPGRRARRRRGVRPLRHPARRTTRPRGSAGCSAGSPTRRSRRSTVGEELDDGQVVPFAGGIRVVHTPGHSPGHASYLHEESGDADHRRRDLQRARAGAGR